MGHIWELSAGFVLVWGLYHNRGCNMGVEMKPKCDDCLLIFTIMAGVLGLSIGGVLFIFYFLLPMFVKISELAGG